MPCSSTFSFHRYFLRSPRGPCPLPLLPSSRSCCTAKAGHRISKGDPARQTVLSEWRFVSTRTSSTSYAPTTKRFFMHLPTYIATYLPTYLSNLTIYLPTYPPISPRQPIDGFFFCTSRSLAALPSFTILSRRTSLIGVAATKNLTCDVSHIVKTINERVRRYSARGFSYGP